MLQQTQTGRVALKFPQFICKFPTIHDLAHASLHEVLLVWQGLGYNRRGKYLIQLAQEIVEKFGGTIPSDLDALIECPGIGKTTAASICAFAFNQPTVFVETNIRTVFLHHFFTDKSGVHDREILILVEQTLDTSNPREWYYALMDYGVFLKQSLGVTNTQSIHYTRQSPFKGSDRQIRGMAVRIVTNEKQCHINDLINRLGEDRVRVSKVLASLIDEGIMVVDGELVHIGGNERFLLR